MKTVVPIGEPQVVPRREIRFKTDPITLPAQVVMLKMAPKFGVVVKAVSVGENGYTKGEIQATCRGANLRRAKA